MREKRMSFRGTEFTVRMDEQRAARLTQRWLYRHAVRPVGRLFRRQGDNLTAPPAAMAAVPVVQPRDIALPVTTPEQRSLVQQVQAVKWYHTIDVGHGVRTPGEFDHGPALRHIPLPDNLAGKRCLDVATFDGYWAFEMERRGAAEVVALDIESWEALDLPRYAVAGFDRGAFDRQTGAAFRVAAQLRGSRVQRRTCNIYDLSPQQFGEFDVVYCGDILVHLTNPLHALQNVCSVTRGDAYFVEPYAQFLDQLNAGAIAQLVGFLPEVRWWHLSRAYLEKAVQLAGFDTVEDLGSVDVRLRQYSEAPAPRAVFRASNQMKARIS